MQEDLAELAALFQQEGIERVKREMTLNTQGKEAEQVFFRLWGSDGEQLATTESSNWSGLARVPEKILRDLGDGDRPVFNTLKLPSREDRVRTIIGNVGPGTVLELGQSLEKDEEFVAEILRGFLLTLAAVLLFGGPIGWFMARRALRGVKEVTRTANEITGGALDRRVPVDPKATSSTTWHGRSTRCSIASRR